MGERAQFQPLTKEDRISVRLYRAGIAASSLIISIIAVCLFLNVSGYNIGSPGLLLNAGIIALYVSVGISVFFIHLYVGKFHKALKRLYYIAIVALIALFAIGGGDISDAVVIVRYGSLLLLPLSGCLGFITAKEAFCFRLMEGYVLALVMPLYLLVLSFGALSAKGASSGLFLIAVMLIFFTFRKVFMPLHYDIGDKSAYC